MKKIILFLLLGCFLLVGCNKNSEQGIINRLNKKINRTNAYKLDGNLEIVNNDEVYKYKVEVSYKKGDYYKVSLTNTNNNHTQIILRNKDAVYILTPSLNKSFKFQSDWPSNNSQIYLLKSIIEDINNDKNRKFSKNKDTYQFITKANYPNNKKLVKQKIVLSKNLNIKEVIIYDKNGSTIMDMKFNKISYRPSFNKNYFKIKNIMKSYSIKDNKVKKTSNLDDSIYPLFIPKGTKLANEEKLKKDVGERIIMTFDGKKPFLLVEETTKKEDEFTIVPTSGEPYRLMDTLGVMTDNSLSWTSNGIDYYIVSDVLNKDELVEVAQSINLVQTSK
ncbi:MAG: outer membrane lipoprotein carrier protein LolA [Bacilli bacterium]|nr:outer membrane lipoprotein carrier protein LolA [Bacilli bacterium]